jgi:MFS family permease
MLIHRICDSESNKSGPRRYPCLHAYLTAASIQSAFIAIGKDLGVSLQRATYLTSLQIAILGGAPLFWRPLANRYGRRPVFLLSLICSAVGNMGCAKSSSYASMAVCRAIVAFFISPAAAIGSAVTPSLQRPFFRKDRARYMGIWTLMVTLGVPVSPFIFGFVAYHVNYRWIFWILAIVRLESMSHLTHIS